MKPSILVIMGSTREGRVGESVARWLMRQLHEWQEADFELVDLRDYPLPIYEGPSAAWSTNCCGGPAPCGRHVLPS